MKFLGLIALMLVLAGCAQPPDGPAGTEGNRNPVIQSLSVDPFQIVVGTTATLTVVAIDPDNNPLTFRWSASTGDIIGDGATVRFTASYCCVGLNLVQVTVRDNAGGETSQSADVYISYR